MRTITRLLVGAVLALSVVRVAPAAAPYTKKCPEEDRNVLAVRTARTAVADQCDCAGSATHKAYLRCVAREVKARASAGTLPRSCRRVVTAFEGRSTCGQQSQAVCCRPSVKGKPKTALASVERCARRGGAVCSCDPEADATCARSVFDACTAAATCAATVDAASGPAVVHSHLLPSTDLMMGWIRDIFDQGIRRPAYPADDWAIEWAVERFTALGLQDVRRDPIDVLRWAPQSCVLAVWPQANPDDRQIIPCFAVPNSTPTAGVRAALALETDPNVAGRLAVVDNPFIELPQAAAAEAFGTDFYDPANEFPTLVQILPFSGRFQNVMEPAIAAGAVGFIGIIDGLPWETDQYFVPYDAHQRPIPGVWLSQSNGARVKALLAAGPAEGEIVVDAALEPATSANVIGTLPGASSEWVIIGSHHDGPWASAVEDASGIALVMGQALYWSQVPAAERPHNLLFLLNGGHMSGGAGLIAFVDRNRDWLANVVLELHLEHVAREGRGENGKLVPTDRPEVRWWFTSAIPALQAAVKEAIVTEALERSIIMKPDGFPPGSEAPPTDGAFFYPAGVPIVNLLAAPMYLFDAADTVEMIHEPSLVPISRAAARLVEWTRGRTAAGMRAEVVP